MTAIRVNNVKSDAPTATTQRPYFDNAHKVLGGRGYSLVRDDGQYNHVLGDRRGRLVDIHAFDDISSVINSDGVRLWGADGLAYEADGFSGIGTIAGRNCAVHFPGHPDALSELRSQSLRCVTATKPHRQDQPCSRLGDAPRPPPGSHRPLQQVMPGLRNPRANTQGRQPVEPKDSWMSRAPSQPTRAAWSHGQSLGANSGRSGSSNKIATNADVSITIRRACRARRMRPTPPRADRRAVERPRLGSALKANRGRARRPAPCWQQLTND